MWKRKSLSTVKVMSSSLQPHGLYSPWNSPGQNTEVGSLSLLQGIFPTQVLNPGLSHCWWILYQLSHKGSPRILECVAYPFSNQIFPTQELNRVSCIAGGFFTNWAITEAHSSCESRQKWLTAPRWWSIYWMYWNYPGSLKTQIPGPYCWRFWLHGFWWKLGISF